MTPTLRARLSLTRTRHQAVGPTSERGQSLVEFSLILPIFLFLLLIMLEFGLAFNHKLTIGIATREGARTGSSLAAGGMAATSCGGGNDAAKVDEQVVAGVDRILVSPGSDVVMADISQLRIFQADATGAEVAGRVNVWTLSVDSGGLPTGVDVDPGVGVDRLYFAQSSVTWPASCRQNGVDPDRLGVAIRYTYHLQTALSGFTGAVMHGNQAATMNMNDQTVMVLNPTN